MNEIATPLTKHEQLFTAGNALAMQIMAALDDYRQRKNTDRWDHSANNWASQIHHPCKKQLVHKRVDWRTEKMPTIDNLYRFEEGNDGELLIKEKMMKVGFTIDEGQRRIYLPDYQISGKIDGTTAFPDDFKFPPGFGNIRKAPVEIKTISPHFWDQTRTLKDILEHPKFWINGIPSQLNIYLHAMKLPFGFLVLKTFGKRWRILAMLYDEELFLADRVKAEAVNAHVKAGTYPEPIPFDSSICGLCGFTHMNCHPLHATGYKELSDGEEAELALFCELQDETKAKVKHYETWKEQLIGNEKTPGLYFGQMAIQGRVEISTSVQNRKRVIEDKKDELKAIKAQFEEPHDLTTTKIDWAG